MPERKAGRNPLRWLAPIALIACAFAVWAIASGGASGGDGGGGDTPAATRTDSGATQPATTSRGRRRYTIRSGDTLTGIAARTKVSLERIQELNPDLDAQTLQAGKTIKLRP